MRALVRGVARSDALLAHQGDEILGSAVGRAGSQPCGCAVLWAQVAIGFKVGLYLIYQHRAIEIAPVALLGEADIVDFGPGGIEGEAFHVGGDALEGGLVAESEDVSLVRGEDVVPPVGRLQIH